MHQRPLQRGLRGAGGVLGRDTRLTHAMTVRSRAGSGRPSVRMLAGYRPSQCPQGVGRPLGLYGLVSEPPRFGIRTKTISVLGGLQYSSVQAW